MIVCKEPSYVKVVVGDQTQQMFTDAERDRLGTLLVDRFKAKEYDEGLLEGVRYVQSAFKEKAGDKEAQPAGQAGRTTAGGVRDDAGFFKPETVSQAQDIIKAIKREENKDVLIETFHHAPAGKEAEAASADQKAKDRFFAEWASQRAQEERLNGIYVLVCKEPPYVKVAVGNQTRRTFPDEERDHLGALLVDRFKGKEYDAGLLEGLRYVQSALTEKAKADGPTTGSAGPAPWQPPGGAGDGPGFGMGLGGLLCVGLVVIGVIGAGLMALMAVARSLHHGTAGYGPGDTGQGDTGQGDTGQGDTGRVGTARGDTEVKAAVSCRACWGGCSAARRGVGPTTDSSAVVSPRLSIRPRRRAACRLRLPRKIRLTPPAGAAASGMTTPAAATSGAAVVAAPTPAGAAISAEAVRATTQAGVALSE